MKVIVRANTPAASDADEHQVVVELRMSTEEARKHALKAPRVDETIDEAIEEHLKRGFRVARNLETGRG